ncbi:MAG: hypothetical protein WC113_03530 [Candidatus Paceibacterota bacterium]|jgi:hypothetical protein
MENPKSVYACSVREATGKLNEAQRKHKARISRLSVEPCMCGYLRNVSSGVPKAWCMPKDPSLKIIFELQRNGKKINGEPITLLELLEEDVLAIFKKEFGDAIFNREYVAAIDDATEYYMTMRGLEIAKELRTENFRVNNNLRKDKKILRKVTKNFNKRHPEWKIDLPEAFCRISAYCANRAGKPEKRENAFFQLGRLIPAK